MAAEKTASIGQPNTSGGTVPSAGDRRRPEPGACAFPVVEIGVAASAGGLEATRRLLGALADEPGVALVIIPRLESSGAGSDMAPEHFIGSTRMRVCRVEDNPRVEPNVVYVSSPGPYVGLDECVLRSSEPERTQGRFVIDHFLRSLVRDAMTTGLVDRVLAPGYPGSIEANVAPWRLGRFFSPEEGCDSYRVSPQLREAVLFAEQDLLGDAPFSRIDLVCCRNLLLPIRPELQEKAISLLHYAMHEGGALFLGRFRTVSPRMDLFKPLDARSRIYRRIGPAGRARRQLRVCERIASRIDCIDT